MANLSAPTVAEPLYDCSTSLVVSGYVPGATVAIHAQPPGPGAAVQIGGGVSNSTSGQVFGVAAASMVPGAIITATQTFGGGTSPPSSGAVVEAALSVDAPVLTAPLLECGRCVRVDGLLPGVKVEVRDAGASIGHASAAGSAVHVPIAPPFATGHAITARQVYCGNPGPDSPALTVGAVREKKLQLAAPEVRTPLFACQPSVVVDGCMPGCQVELFVNGVPTAAGCAIGTAVNLGVAGGLVKGTSITAQLSLCNGAIQSPPSALGVVQPADAIPKPVVWPPLYEGDTSVLVGMTVSGEITTITADGVQIGMGGAGGGNAPLNVDPPLVAGQKVVATVELCSVKKSSLPVTVLPAPTTVNPPSIVKPLVACAPLVNVADCIPGAEVRVYAQSGGNTVLLGIAHAFSAATTVWTTPPLKTGWSVHATQKVGGTTSAPSAAVVVVAPPAPPTPALAKSILACARCVRVSGLVVGARVDVYQEGVWVGGAYAAGFEIDVAVYPGLAAGTTITATQTVCGKVSKAATAPVVRGPEKVPAPVLQPAFAGQAFVPATQLLPGAVVEVEEISVYGQVIGKACVTAGSAVIGVNLPLFAGGRLRARQTLCTTSAYSPTIVVAQPPEWPLGPGAFMAGFRLVADVPVSADVPFQGAAVGPCNGGMYDFVRPAANKAVVFYPATADGQDAPVAAGGPFPIVVFGHGRRWPSCFAQHGWEACAGAPQDTVEDYRQLSGILSHLARWGVVSIAPDLSWLAPDFGTESWRCVMADAAGYIVAQNGNAGSPLQGHLKTASLSLLGHSTSGIAALELAIGGTLSIDAVVLLAPAGGVNEASSLSPVPVMVIRGTADSGPFGDGGNSDNVYAAAGPPKHMVTITGANHFGFTDSLCILADPVSTVAQGDQQRIATAYLTAFFRRYVNGAVEVEDYLTGARPVEELEAFTIVVDSLT